MRFFFFRAFNAKSFPVEICLAKKTFPKAPEPKVLTILKEAKFTLFVAIELNYSLKAYIYGFWAFALLAGVSLRAYCYFYFNF